MGALHASWRHRFNSNLKSLGTYSEWVLEYVVGIFLRILTGFFFIGLEFWQVVGFIYHTSIFLGSELALSSDFHVGNILAARIVRIVSRVYHRVYDFAERYVACLYEL